jgi:3-hydroxyisobutyrate dehydrogenase-like beta-hydroxyacid dehydrogenase
MSETVAVLGAGGTMGSGMARNLLRAGVAVRAWNRTAERAKPLEADAPCSPPHLPRRRPERRSC